MRLMAKHATKHRPKLTKTESINFVLENYGMTAKKISEYRSMATLHDLRRGK
jgi:hypothetical protein